jgi:hypothetical protein
MYNMTRGITKPGHQWHHILPKFLGGDANGLSMLMKTEDHRAFHAILREHLRRAVPPSGGWSTKTWEAYLADPKNSGKCVEVFAALVGAAKQFDREVPGYHLWHEVLRQFKEQEWLFR